jgi:hypothetical protein
VELAETVSPGVLEIVRRIVQVVSADLGAFRRFHRIQR